MLRHSVMAPHKRLSIQIKSQIEKKRNQQECHCIYNIKFRIFAICTSVTSFVFHIFSILYVHIFSYKFYVICNAKSRGTKVPRLYL